jgi:hypothetical protein
MDSMRDDLRAELRFWSDAHSLDVIASIIGHSERWYDVAARVAEHRPELSPFDQQLEVKRRLVESAPRGGRELADWFMRSLP